jgi:ribosome biogenesis protein Tsr3
MVGKFFLQCIVSNGAPSFAGRPWKLNCAEAIAAAFYITGLKPYGEIIMEKFSWGTSFIPLNGWVCSS